MKRLLVALVVVVVSACAKEAPKTEAPPKETQTTPPPLPATQALYAQYASAPTTFDRLPHLSRFYTESQRSIDAACNRGEQLPACQGGDRFSCVDRPPTKPGTVKAATLNGEQPGVSATVALQLQFGDVVTAVDADVVFEDGAWKIDQVRCAPKAN